MSLFQDVRELWEQRNRSIITEITFPPRLKSGMTLAIFTFSRKVPVWKDKLNICVIGFTIDVITLLVSLKSMSSQSVDVLLLQPFTTDITSHSSTGERNIVFLFLEVK